MRSGIILVPFLMIAVTASADDDPREKARAIMATALEEQAPLAPRRPQIPAHPLEEKKVPAPDGRGLPASPALEKAALHFARTHAFQLLFGAGSLGPPIDVLGPSARPGRLPADASDVADRSTHQRRTDAARPVTPPVTTPGGR